MCVCLLVGSNFLSVRQPESVEVRTNFGELECAERRKLSEDPRFMGKVVAATLEEAATKQNIKARRRLKAGDKSYAKCFDDALSRARDPNLTRICSLSPRYGKNYCALDKK